MTMYQTKRQRTLGKQWHGGKGDKPRGVDKSKYDEGWDRIFGKPKPKPKVRKKIPAHGNTQKHLDKKKEQKKTGPKYEGPFDLNGYD